MAFLTKGMWVIVADSEKAMVLENMGDTATPDLRQIDRVEAEKVVMNADRPGRVQESMNPGRSAMETPDFARLNAEAMVADLVERLEKKGARSALPHIVVVAPPQVLGAIRDRMTNGLRGRVVAEIDKTLTKHPMAKIAEIVAEELGAG